MKIFILFFNMNLLFLLTCTTGDRNNPVDPNGSAYIDSLHLNLPFNKHKQFINDTLLLIASSDNPSILRQYECKPNPISISNDTLKFVWNNPGEQSLSIRAIDIYNRPTQYNVCAVSVLLGQPTVSLKKNDSTFIHDSVSITASGKDTNGSIVEYQWSVNNSAFEKGEETFTRAFSDTGKKIIKVKVIDDDSIESPVDSCLLYVRLGQPSVTAPRDTFCFINDSSTFIAKAEDPNGNIINYFWSVDSGKQFIAGGSTLSNAWKTPGQRKIYVKAIDDDNIQSNATSFSVIIRECKPTVKLLPVANATIRDSVEFSATHYDTNGTVIKYIWQYSIGSIVHVDTLDTRSFKILWPDTGKKSVILKAIDDDGLISVPDSCIFTMTFGPKPVIDAMKDSSCYIKDSVKVTASGADQDGSVVKFIWAANTTIFKDTTSSGVKTFFWPDSGIRTIRIRAIDNDGQLSDIDSCVIRVKAGLPILIPVSDTIVSFANNVPVSRLLKVSDENLCLSGMTWFLDTGSTTGWDYSSKDSIVAFSKPGGGVLNVVWAACDDDSNFTKGDTFKIIFNHPPSCSLIAPRDTAVWQAISPVTCKGSVIFKWSGSDPDGLSDIVQYNLALGKTLTSMQTYYAGPLTSDTITILDTLTLYYWKVTVRDSFGDTASSVGTFITNYAPPVILSEPHDTSFSKGDSAIFSIVATGHDLHYSWRRGTTVVSTSDQPVLKIPNAAYPDRDTTYYCIVSNSMGSDTSRFARLIVLPAKPVIVDPLKPADTTVTQRNSVRFRVSASGDSLHYQWQRNTVNITPNGNDSVYTLDSAKLSDNGVIFRCIISNNGGNTISRDAKLTVTLAPPVIVTQQAPVEVIVGNRARLKISAIGDSITYQWQKDGIDLIGKNSDSLIITNATFADSGNYRCMVNNSAGNDSSNVIKVTVIQQPLPAVPTLVTPTNASSNQPLTLTLSWNAATYATLYEVQLSTVADFSILVLYDSMLTSTSKVLSSLLNNTTYYWRVRAKNDAGKGAWSIVSNFSTLTTVTDADGNVYTTVVIGNQIWTVENLRTTKYNDGTSIPHVTDSASWATRSTPGYCYYNNTTSSIERVKWGALYNWYAVNTGKLAPPGWRVPSDSDWIKLENYLITNGYNYDGTTSGNKIAKSLAAKTDWSSSDAIGAVGNVFSNNNRTGFSALPGGCRGYIGASFNAQSYYGYWWSSSMYDTSKAGFRYCMCSFNGFYSQTEVKGFGFSVRLVKDLN